jgi:hypothetical protein
MLPQILALLLLFTPAQTDPPKPPKGATSQPAETRKAVKKAAKKKHARTDAKSKPQTPSPRNLAVRAMNTVIDQAEFKDVTFEDFVEWLERTTKANVIVRWKVLEKAGVERDRPINLKEKNIKLRKLLPLVFAQVTEDLRDVELAAKASDNILTISTRADFNAVLETRVYEVEDLLFSVPDFAAVGADMSGPGWRIGDRLLIGGGWEKCREKEEVVQELISAITNHIERSSWKVNGGKGTIRHFQGRLVISNNAEVHQQLADFLGDKSPPPQDEERLPISH